MQSVPKKIMEYGKLGLPDVEYVEEEEEEEEDEKEEEEEEEEEEELWHLASHDGVWTYQPSAVTTWLGLYGMSE
jgi:hypothetical protein